MKKISLLFIQALLPALLLAAPEGDVTGEQSLDPRIMAADTGSSGSVLKTAWLAGRDADAAKEADRLIESLRAADRDTLDFPEAGFTVSDPNPEFEKLLNRGGQNLNDLEYLLADLKNGFFRQRMIEALAWSAPEKAAGIFRQALKDRSSGVRFSAMKALMRTADEGAIQYFTPLLYDRYAQRRDFYPVRAAARDAIDFLRLKAETRELNGSGKAAKYCEALKEKAGKKQYYFCEVCGKELGNISDGADSIYLAYLELKSPAAEAGGAPLTVTPQTGAENAAYYMLSALAALKDIRVKDDILALLADKDNSLPGFRLMVSFDPAEALRAWCPSGLQPEVLAGLLSEGRVAELSPLKPELLPDDTFRAALIKKVMSSRKFSAYIDAAKIYYEIIFDREKAQGWLSAYDPSASGMEQPYNGDYAKVKALCLLSSGKAEEAAQFDPYSPVPLFKRYVPAVNIMRSVPAQGESGRIAGEALYKAYLALNIIPCAMQQLSALAALPGIDEAEREKYWSENRRLGELQAEKLGTLALPADSGNAIQVRLSQPVNKPGEDVKAVISIRNDSPDTAYVLDSSGGPLGFDAGLFLGGVAVKRLFTDETEKLSAEEAGRRVAIIAPGALFEKEYIILPAAQNTAENEYELAAGYDGGAPVKGFEKGWIGKLISEPLKVTIKK